MTTIFRQGSVDPFEVFKKISLERISGGTPMPAKVKAVPVCPTCDEPIANVGYRKQAKCGKCEQIIDLTYREERSEKMEMANASFREWCKEKGQFP